MGCCPVDFYCRGGTKQEECVTQFFRRVRGSRILLLCVWSGGWGSRGRKFGAFFPPTGKKEEEEEEERWKRRGEGES